MTAIFLEKHGGHFLWNAHDKQAVRDNYRQHGPRWSGWGKVLQVHRSYGSIKAEAAQLGLSVEHGALWDEHDKQIMRDNYRKHGPRWDGWNSLLHVPRDAGGIEKVAHKLGLTNCPPKYSDHDKKAIRDNYAKHGPRWSGWQHVLDVPRSVVSLESEAVRLGATNAQRIKAQAVDKTLAWREENDRRRHEAERRRRAKQLKATVRSRAIALARAYKSGRITGRLLDQVCRGVCGLTSDTVREIASRLSEEAA